MKKNTFHRLLIFRLIITSLILSGALGFQNLSAQDLQPYLLKDINPGAGDSWALFTAESIVSTDKLFFMAHDGVHGTELWVTNGTREGTLMVKDINPGSSGSMLYLANSGSYNGKLYFAAFDGEHGSELWATDGTNAGTQMIKDITAGSPSTDVKGFKTFNGYLYFTTNDIFWVTNGTEASTQRVKDISVHSDFFVYDNKLYFNANDGEHGSELWVSDGTPEGTLMLKDINNGGSSSLFNFIEFDQRLFFYGDDGIHGNELWVTDGTEIGTHLVKDINPGPSSFNYYNKSFVFGDRLYLVVDDGTHGRELWSTDGTEAGTQMVKDINLLSGQASLPYGFYEFNGKLYFSADDGTYGRELWITDGTENGTVLLKDIYLGEEASNSGGFKEYNGLLYFIAKDEMHGYELWSTDGTIANTTLLKDILPGPNHGLAYGNFDLTELNGKLYFGAYDEQYDYSLWESDGTAAGTILLRPENSAIIKPMIDGFHPIVFQNELYVMAIYDENVGIEPYKLTSQPLAINQSEVSNLVLYPNPTDSELYISSDIPIEKAAVHNLQGRLLISSNFNDSKNEKATLDLSELVVGVYFVKITSGGLEKTYKIIKK